VDVIYVTPSLVITKTDPHRIREAEGIATVIMPVRAAPGGESS
jgi:hypothetical protein